MPIVKRLDPAERFEQQYGAMWRRVKDFPLVKSVSRSDEIDTSPEGFSRMLASFGNARWITEVKLDVKMFFYMIELVCNRAGIDGFLSEDFVVQLKRHMNTMGVIERMDNIDGVSFAARQVFVWDIPAFLARYPRPGTLPLPDPSTPLKIKPKPPIKRHLTPAPTSSAKPLRKRLPQHRR